MFLLSALVDVRRHLRRHEIILMILLYLLETTRASNFKSNHHVALDSLSISTANLDHLLPVGRK